MKRPSGEALLLVPLLAACAPIGVTAYAGYTQMALRGDIALTTGSGTTGNGAAAPRQDFDSGFGLGDERGSPYLRAQVDFGVPVLTASGFWLRETGAGVLDDAFGGLAGATPVLSDLDLTLGKISCSFDIELGALKVSPGLAVDLFDLRFRVRDLSGNSEEIDELLALPMLFVRTEGSFGGLGLIGEAGYLEIPNVSGNKARFFDLEAMVDWPILPLGSVFGGYRFIDLGANGDTNADSFEVDLQVRGWFIGGGLRF
ncbi:MAG: hypothetical protein ABIP94_23325 [Planctomycetota bacterium]